MPLLLPAGREGFLSKPWRCNRWTLFWPAGTRSNSPAIFWPDYYQAAVRANLGGLLVHLCRNWLEEADFQNAKQDKKLYMVKTAIRYIREHMTENLTVESISTAVGFSKYYFCRTFKEMTGQTVIDYINATRCGFARWLLLSGRYNVSETAERSGFTNLSYFTKIYKKYMGQLPSQAGRQGPQSDSAILNTFI